MSSQEIKRFFFKLLGKLKIQKSKKEYFEKLKGHIIQETKQQSIQHYNLKVIFSRFEPRTKSVTIPDLQREINTIKEEISNIKKKILKINLNFYPSKLNK